MKTTLTKEKAQELIDSLDSYRKYGKIIYSFDGSSSLDNNNYEDKNWKIVEEYDGQFSGGYSTTIYQSAYEENYYLIISCDPEGNLIKEELRSTDSIS